MNTNRTRIWAATLLACLGAHSRSWAFTNDFTASTTFVGVATNPTSPPTLSQARALTNGLATTAFVTGQGYVTASVTNGLPGASITNGTVTAVTGPGFARSGSAISFTPGYVGTNGSTVRILWASAATVEMQATNITVLSVTIPANTFGEIGIELVPRLQNETSAAPNFQLGMATNGVTFYSNYWVMQGQLDADPLVDQEIAGGQTAPVTLTVFINSTIAASPQRQAGVDSLRVTGYQ